MDMTPERIDPVSGNDIPLGATAENVRDDIPAQLSEGEYVVPADVVNYYGVKFFEDLRAEAKEGFQEMAETGRIGGEPIETPMDDAFPFDVSELQVEDDVAGYSDGGLGSQYGQVGSYDLGSGYMQDYAPVPPVAPVAAPQVAAPEVAAPTTSGSQAGAQTGRRGPVVVPRRVINPATGQQVTVHGYYTPGSTSISEINSGNDAFKPGFQYTDRDGNPITLPTGFIPLSEHEGRPTGLLGNVFPQDGSEPTMNLYEYSIGQHLGNPDKVHFDPTDPDVGIYRPYASKPRSTIFDRVQGYDKLSLDQMESAVDERFGVGSQRGQSPGFIGAFGGFFNADETNTMIQAIEDDIRQYRAAGDTENLRRAEGLYYKVQAAMDQHGLDKDQDGLADYAVETALGRWTGFDKGPEVEDRRIDRLSGFTENAGRGTSRGAAPTVAQIQAQRQADAQRKAAAEQRKTEEAAKAAADRQLSAFSKYQNMNQGGMVRSGYNGGGMAVPPEQARKARVAEAVRKRKAQREARDLGLNPDLALLNPREEAAPTTSGRTADNRNRLGNFFQSAGEAIGSVPNAIGSGLAHITGTPTPMQDMAATARAGLDAAAGPVQAGLNMAGEGLDMLRSAPEAAIDMATDASRFLAAAPGNYINRVSGQEASDAYQAGYEAGFAAGQRAVRADTGRAESIPMMREAQSQAAAVGAAQQAQAASDAASMAGARSRYIDQLDNQEIGTYNMGVLERRRAFEEQERQRIEEANRQRVMRESQELASMEDLGSERYQAQLAAEERERQELARLAELEAQRQAQLEEERRMRAQFGANKAQDRFQSDAELAAMYEVNNQLEALLAESDDLERQQERLINQYQSSAQGE